jgi:hypothetical protein
MNYQLRKVIKTRSQFTTDEAVYRLLYLAICDIELRTTTWAGTRRRSCCNRGASTLHWTEALTTSQDSSRAGSPPPDPRIRHPTQRT